MLYLVVPTSSQLINSQHVIFAQIQSLRFKSTLHNKAATKLMGSNSSGSSSSSQRLETLAKQLRLYNAPPSHDLSSNPQSTTNLHEISKLKRAAVLICLFYGDQDELRVILTKRSSTLSSHSGEVSLPGGKTEEGDSDDIETALREAKEEIGLDPALVDVVTVLQPFTQKRGMTIVPVIGLLSDKNAFSSTPNPAEVEAIFDAPLEMFLKDEKRKEEEREWMGDKYLLHYFEHEAEDNNMYVIWAITAGILIKAASIVYQRPPAFLERAPKFWHS